MARLTIDENAVVAQSRLVLKAHNRLEAAKAAHEQAKVDLARAEADETRQAALLDRAEKDLLIVAAGDPLPVREPAKGSA